MLTSRKWPVCLLVLGMNTVVTPLSEQAREPREHAGTQVCPARFGTGLLSLFGPIQNCGTRGYARVFTGTVASVVAISDTEERLELIPDEVFLGDPISKVTAAVNQSCLPGNQSEIQSGDKWRFYLRSDPYS